MVIVTYIERRFIDRFTCIDMERTVKGISTFIQGGLTYIKINSYNYKVVETEFIKSINEL